MLYKEFIDTLITDVNMAMLWSTCIFCTVQQTALFCAEVKMICVVYCLGLILFAVFLAGEFKPIYASI